MHCSSNPQADRETSAALHVLDSLTAAGSPHKPDGNETGVPNRRSRKCRLTLWVPDTNLAQAGSFTLLKTWAGHIEETGLTFVSSEEITVGSVIACAVLPLSGVALLKADVSHPKAFVDGFWVYRLTFQGRVSAGDLPLSWRRKLTCRNGISAH